MSGLALRFYECVVPDSLRDDHLRRGGQSLRRYVAAVTDGEVRFMSGREPAGNSGQLITHVSVTVGRPGILAPFRAPTDDEMDAVRSMFSLVTFNEENFDGDPRCRHLWEVER